MRAQRVSTFSLGCLSRIRAPRPTKKSFEHKIKNMKTAASPVFTAALNRTPDIVHKTKAAFSRMRRLLWLRVNFERAIDLSH